jgi:hypothetical protein
MTKHISKEMERKRDRMIGTGRFTYAQIAKACGTTEGAIEKSLQRKKTKPGQSGQFIVQGPTDSIEEAGPGSPDSLANVPASPAGVRAELNRMLGRQKEMEKALQDDGPQAMPAILAILGEQRKTIEAIIKAEVVFANMPAGPTDMRVYAGAVKAEAEAFLAQLLPRLTEPARAEVLKAITELGEPPK